jgi:hypothetical protein
MSDECEAQPVGAEPLCHVAAIEETQLQQPATPSPPNAEGTRVETTDDPPSDVEDDDDAEAQSHPDATGAERPRRQEHERRMVARLRPPRRRGHDMEHGLPAGRDPEPPRP